MGSGTTAPPRTVSSAFAESDVVRQRRENVLQWRLEREAAKRAEEEAKTSRDNKSELKKFTFEPVSATASTPTKAWNWDDDDDEDESTKKDVIGDVIMADQSQEQDEEKEEDAAMDEDEVDPLDAFMVDVTAEVKQLEKKEQKRDLKVNKSLSKAENATPSSTGAEEDEEEDPAESSEEEDILAMAAKRIKKKDIPAVDHSKMHYEFFRKNFYLEPPEMADMTPEEVHMLRLELDGIKIRGADCPKPIRKWTQAGLPAGW